MTGLRNAPSSKPTRSATPATRKPRLPSPDGGTPANGGEPGGRDDIAPPGAFVLRQVGHLLRRAYAIARRNSAEALSALGDVSPVQASVLGALAQGALTQAELGRRIGMEPANTHAIVRRMATAGLIEMRRDPANRRLVLAALTGEGSAVAARLGNCIEAATTRTLAALDPNEQKALIEMLARIVVADAEVAGPVPGQDSGPLERESFGAPDPRSSTP